MSASVRCQFCGKTFEAKQEARARFCGDPCRWAAWKQKREDDARAPLERVLRVLVARMDELFAVAEEAKAALKADRATRDADAA